MGSFRVVRGGGWYNGGYGGALSLRVAYRNGSGPSDHNYDFGFRCAADAGL